jgi:hypothetical protein
MLAPTTGGVVTGQAQLLGVSALKGCDALTGSEEVDAVTCERGVLLSQPGTTSGVL